MSTWIFKAAFFTLMKIFANASREGLKRQYENYTEFVLLFRNIPALAFEPLDHVGVF